MAPSWWTIIIWANIVSASLCTSSASVGEVLSVVSSAAVPAAGSSGAVSPLPHAARERGSAIPPATAASRVLRSEEHTSELQSLGHLVCRLLLEKKNLLELNTIN